MSRAHRALDAARHPGRWLTDVTGGGPVFAIVVLFGLNAVDELDRTAFGILLPEIRDHFGLDVEGILTLVAVVLVAALALQVPIAYLAERSSRVRLAWIGAAAWGFFSILTGLAPTLVVLGIARAGSGIGKAVIDPTHNSLIADYYDVPVRPNVYSLHRAANAVGAFVGPLTAGLLAYWFGWRAPFFVFAVPTFVFVVLAWRLREPVRGMHERRAAGATAGTVSIEEEPPSFAEGWRMVWKIEALRRIWYALPFLAAALIGFVALASLMYDETYGLDERARGFVAAGVEPVQLVGLAVGALLAGRFLREGGPARVLGFLSKVAFVVAGLLVAFALAPNLGIAVVMNALLTASAAALVPGVLASLSMAIPPRARSIGFSVASLWIIPGLAVLPIVGAVGDRWGMRPALLIVAPLFLIGGLIVATGKNVIGRDIERVWAAAAARAEVVRARREGRSPLLLVRDLEVSYGSVQVLFGVDVDVEEGSIVALVGTNGAGKSTLMKAIAGAIASQHGAVIFDGREITDAPSHEVAAKGVMLVPGGAGVFPSLTVRENLRVAAWLSRSDHAAVDAGFERIDELFPGLRRRFGDPAGDLSGGQRQMLTLAMALLSRPRLLLIDELSLGLAPSVVEQLLPAVAELRSRGTTVLLVEQSLDVALRIADTAYVMERGEIPFHGPAEELKRRPEVLRSVFLAEATGLRFPPWDTTDRAVRHARALPGGDRSEKAPALVTIDLSRSFGGIRAVDTVSLVLTPGEILGVIGPNGAGKTTLFDLVSGLTSADEGRIVLEGTDVTRLSAHARARLGLGRSFQDTRLYPALTVEEAIAVALERWIDVRDPLSPILHLPRAFDAQERVEKRVDEVVELLGLGRFRNSFVRELSTGTRRVVDLACIIAHHPSVVLLDEPSNGIAQREVDALGPLLLRVREELGATLAVVDHDVALVRAVADRLVAMDAGAVIAEGHPDDVLRHPRVVASYLGATAPAGVAREPT